MVEEANSDNKLRLSEVAYLLELYVRTATILKTITDALYELDANDKANIVVEKAISMNEFIKELDNNFEPTPLKKKEVNRKPLRNSIIITLIAVFMTIFLPYCRQWNYIYPIQ